MCYCVLSFWKRPQNDILATNLDKSCELTQTTCTFHVFFGVVKNEPQSQRYAHHAHEQIWNRQVEEE